MGADQYCAEDWGEGREIEVVMHSVVGSRRSEDFG